ncbi:hypothetical protein [Nostoc sp.]|uniref:hypothetical protein n=1 Tax=unclassified Nostoc TaxID=2593658 RepID=UPI003FA54D85
MLLTKSDRVDEQTQVRIQDWLKQNLSPGVKVIPCQDGKISSNLLLGFNAAVEDNLDPTFRTSECNTLMFQLILLIIRSPPSINTDNSW